MTVCIAARAGNVIVAASDRMLTAGDVQFEPQSPKIIRFTSSAFVMTSGDSALQAEIVMEAHLVINNRIRNDQSNWWLIKDIVDVYIEQYNLAKLKRSENQILAPLNLNRKTYLSEQRSMMDQLVLDLSKELINFELPTISCIIAGTDPTGAHIYSIRDNKYLCCDSVGFATIGIGARHASSQLMLSGQSYYSSLSDTLLAVYNAKKRAEVAPGVGKATDMVSVGPGLGSLIKIHGNT